MAARGGNSGIKGITIEIDGNTGPLEEALKDVNKQARNLQTELTQIDRGLRFNPGNAELIAQQQQVLAQRVQTTSQKLDQLRAAQAQVEAQFARGDISAEQYRAFNRELANTEGQLNGLQRRMRETQEEQARLGRSQQDLRNFFDATRTSVDNYADVLGNDLTRAIREGRATSQQLEQALDQIGRSALGSEADLDRMRRTLRNLDDGGSLDDVREELNRIEQEANQTEEAVKGVVGELASLAGGLAAGGGISMAVSKALDMSKLDTQIKISFNVPEESVESVRKAIVGLNKYGIEGEEALEGVRRQWALNKNASDEVNAGIVKGAAVIANAYNGVDFTELIQETNEIAAGLEISNEEALALTNALLKAGFPPEQLDTIAEYGMQMKNAGFSVAEIQSIFEQGINTKSWNVDNLNDGVKEARITMSEFGLEVDDTMADLLKSAGMGADKFKKWGKAVSDGGAGGSKAMAEMVTWLDGIQDSTLKNELAIKVFGTKWEDQGQNLISVFQGIEGAQDKTVENQGLLNDAITDMDVDPTVKLKEGFDKMMESLRPLLQKVVEVITAIANWISENPKFTAAIVAIGTVLGVVVGAFMALYPIVQTLISLWPILAGAFAGVTVPIWAIIAAVVAVIAAFVGLVVYWDEIKKYLGIFWEWVKNGWNSMFTAIGDWLSSFGKTVSNIWSSLVSTVVNFVTNLFNSVKTIFTNIFSTISTIISNVYNFVKSTFNNIFSTLSSILTSISNFFKTTFSNIFSTISNIISNVYNFIKSTFNNIFSTLSSVLTSIFNFFKTTFSNIFSTVSTIFVNIFNTISTIISNVHNFIKSTFSNIFSTLSSILTNIYNFFKTTFGNIFNTVSNIFGNIFSKISTVATNIWQKVVDIFGKVTKAITTPFQNAKDAVAKIIDKIKGLFKFEFKWPKLKMPTFSIKGSMNPIKWLEEGVPKLSVKWNALGGIFNRPTILNSTQGLQGVGEAGSEAILPLNAKTLGGIGAGIAATMGNDGMAERLDSLAAAITELASRPISLMIDGREIVLATFDQTNQQFATVSNTQALFRGERK